MEKDKLNPFVTRKGGMSNGYFNSVVKLSNIQ